MKVIERLTATEIQFRYSSQDAASRMNSVPSIQLSRAWLGA